MQTYEGERHPLQDIVDNCDTSIASWRSAVFIGCWFTFFNVCMVLIRSLELWGEMPWQWFPGFVTVLCLLVHLFSGLIVARTWRNACVRRQRWIDLRRSCLTAMAKGNYSNIEFHLDQINAGFEKLNQ